MDDPWDDDDPLEDEEPSPEAFFQTALLFESGLIVVALLLGWAFSQQPPAGLDFLYHSNRQILVAAGWGLAATIPLAIVFWLIDRFGKRWFADLDRIATESIGPMFAQVDLSGLILVALAAGIGEEMLFRGFLQGLLAESMVEPYGTWVAVGMAAVVFGFCHYLSFNYFVVATLMGVYLGALWVFSGSLLAPMVTHATYDLLALWYITRFKVLDEDPQP